VDPQVNYLLVKSSPLVRVLSQMHPVYNFSPSFPKIHSNIIFPSTSSSLEWNIICSEQYLQFATEEAEIAVWVTWLCVWSWFRAWFSVFMRLNLALEVHRYEHRHRRNGLWKLHLRKLICAQACIYWSMPKDCWANSCYVTGHLKGQLSNDHFCRVRNLPQCRWFEMLYQRKFAVVW